MRIILEHEDIKNMLIASLKARGYMVTDLKLSSVHWQEPDTTNDTIQAMFELALPPLKSAVTESNDGHANKANTGSTT